jgi:mono/diheme cytochrome c family protein
MRTGAEWGGILILLAASWACSGSHSARGFRLPEDGDAERGKLAFLAHGCNSCHEVKGASLPAPTVQPPVPVTLGGPVYEELSDGYLVTSVINPGYRLARYPKAQITAGGASRMPEYAGRMTVRQLADIVAFLRANYVVRKLPSRYTQP